MDLSRRELLGVGAGGVALLGGGKAVDNVLLGYGRFTGTNLLRQDLDQMVAEGLQPSGETVATVDDYVIGLDDGDVTVSGGSDDSPIERFDPATADPADAAAVDDDLGLDDGPLEQLVADLGAMEAGDVTFEYDNYPEFFETGRRDDVRPYTVAALRGRKAADPALVASFADADPSNPEAVVEGLADGFREHTSYDFERYVAGSVEDNVMLERVDLRQHFESETDFQAILAEEDSGLFCYELTRRSVEALQAVPAPDQTVPVLGGYVNDTRHKHVYTILTSAVRRDGDFVVPVTFVDYTSVVQHHDFRLTGVLGSGLAAYDDGHRATGIGWYR